MIVGPVNGIQTCQDPADPTTPSVKAVGPRNGLRIAGVGRGLPHWETRAVRGACAPLPADR